MKKVISSFLLLVGLDSTVLFWNSSAPRAESQARIDAQLLPPPITRRNPATVVEQLESFEKRGQLADGVEYEFWTFGDSVPGPLIRVREETRWNCTLRTTPPANSPTPSIYMP